MLSFLYPIAAWGALMVGAGVLGLHFFRRSFRGSDFLFSNTRLLDKIMEARRPGRRLRDIILASLRALIAAMLLLALAKPFWRGAWGQASGPSERNEFWLVLDLSYSMSTKDAAGMSALARALEAAEATASALKQTVPGALVGLVAFSDRIEEDLVLEPSEDLAQLRRFLSKMEIRPRETQQGLWRDWLMRRDLSRAAGVFVFTDMSLHGFTTSQNSGWKREVPIIFVSAASGSLGNRRLSVRQEGPAQAEIRIDCFGVSKSGQLPLNVMDAKNSKSLAVSRVDDCASTLIPVQKILGDQGAAYDQVTFSIPTDRLSIDDSAHFVYSPPQGDALVIVDGEPGRRATESESYYVREALRALRHPGRWFWLSQDEFARLIQTPEASQLRQLWWLHPKDLTPGLAAYLASFIAQPKNRLLISLGPQADTKSLSKILGVALSPERGGASGNFKLEKFGNGPVDLWLGGMRRAQLEAFDLGGVHVSHYMDAPGAAQPVLSLAPPAGQPLPLLFRLSQTPALSYLWTSTVDLEWTNIPLKGFFLNLIQALLSEFAVKESSFNVPVGGTWISPPDSSAMPELTALAPSGHRQKGIREGGRTKLGPLEELGFYQLTWQTPLAPDQPLASAVATHLNSAGRESDLTPASKAQIRSLLGSEVNWVSISAQEIRKNPARAVALLGSKDLFRPILASTLFLLALESLAGWWLGKKK